MSPDRGGAADAAIAVIIATVGRPDALRICLGSLAAQTVKPASVMVVHSGSDDETRALCADAWPARGLTVEYYHYSHKSAALQRDFAVRRTPHPLIMFADDDMEFESDWIEALLDVLQADSRIGATMGNILNQPLATPTVVWRIYRRLVSTAPRATQPGAVVGALVHNGFPADAAEPLPAEWIGGCITLLRKDAYLSVGGFAPHYRGSSPGEDIDLGYRLSRQWRVYYVPSARCLHHQSPTGREGIGRQQFLWMRSRYAFCRSSVGMKATAALWHTAVWALFQTASEVGQLRRGTLRDGFLAACWGRTRGWWSCVGWDSSAERFPDWHQTNVSA